MSGEQSQQKKHPAAGESPLEALPEDSAGAAIAGNNKSLCLPMFYTHYQYDERSTLALVYFRKQVYYCVNLVISDRKGILGRDPSLYAYVLVVPEHTQTYSFGKEISHY